MIVRRQNADGTLDVEGIDPRVGKLSGVPYATGLVGCRLVFTEGATARLQWRGGDETQPLICLTEMLAKTEPWGKAVARVGDSVVCGELTFTAVAGPGGIATIALTYTPPGGDPAATTITPGVPAMVQLAGQIRTGSEEVFIQRWRPSPLVVFFGEIHCKPQQGIHTLFTLERNALKTMCAISIGFKSFGLLKV